MIDLLGQTVSIEERSSVNSDGIAIYNTAQSLPARVELKNISIAAEGGKQVIADAVCYLPSHASVSMHARLTYLSNTYRVVWLRSYHDLDGPRYHRVMLQKLT